MIELRLRTVVILGSSMAKIVVVQQGSGRKRFIVDGVTGSDVAVVDGAVLLNFNPKHHCYL